jgi:hypothetical protein
MLANTMSQLGQQPQMQLDHDELFSSLSPQSVELYYNEKALEKNSRALCRF